MSKVLLTGCSGFIGSHLSRFLIEKGFEVVGVDNFITGSESNTIDLKSSFTLINHDISEPLDIKESFDYVLHFASPASPIDYGEFPLQTLKAGSFGTYNALEITRKNNAVFFLASTSEVYGDPETNPQTELYWGNVNPIGPRSCYDEAKRYAESLTVNYHKTYGMDVKIARIFNTFGPSMRKKDGRVIPNFITQALRGEPLSVYGDGSQTRSFCYISDMIKGLYALMTSSENNPVNLGNPDERSILELSETILKISESESKLEFKDLPKDDPKTRRPDISKAKKVLNWTPEVSTEEGIKKTVEWFKEVL